MGHALQCEKGHAWERRRAVGCAVLTVKHGVGNVRGLRTCGPGGISHGVHHTRDAARLASHVALVDSRLLEQKHLGARGGGEEVQEDTCDA